MDNTLRQILAGLALALPSFLLGILGWVQVKKKGTTDVSSKQIDQLLQGYRDFTEEVQKDNEDLRELVTKWQDQLKACEDGRIRLTKEHEQLKLEHKQLKRKIDALAKTKDK